MFSPELLLMFGLLMVIGSAIALMVAQSTRNWFFHTDSFANVKLIDLARQPVQNGHER